MKKKKKQTPNKQQKKELDLDLSTWSLASVIMANYADHILTELAMKQVTQHLL